VPEIRILRIPLATVLVARGQARLAVLDAIVGWLAVSGEQLLSLLFPAGGKCRSGFQGRADQAEKLVVGDRGRVPRAQLDGPLAGS
jgi:hypothetical protein